MDTPFRPSKHSRKWPTVRVENISYISSLAGHHARVPVLILGVSIAEPLVTRCEVYCRRVVAVPIARRDALAQPPQVRVLVFLCFHRHDTPCAAILPALVGLPEKRRHLSGMRISDSAK